ncbi:MAG TPA: sulfotransferase domain-containing protein [Bryobacteraceae bacterium]|nr:sulfotransferase domain-containing protein [Bryobacteraceae bacterium]
MAGDTRILIACSMKSGSSFVSRALAAYLGVPFVEAVDYWGRREQNLLEDELLRFVEKPFLIQMHVRPHVPNLEIIRKYNIRVVYLWRNLGDVVVSFDDHIRREDYRNPVGYIHHPARYLALPVQHRYAYLIDHALPWYTAFHLSWRDTPRGFPIIRGRYEHMAADPQGFFERLLEALGIKPDYRRLERTLNARIEGTRYNIGISGRSKGLLSESNQRRLDDFLLRDPEDLAELWAELPWRDAGRPATGSLLTALAGQPFNARAGLVEPSFPGLRIRVETDGFWIHVPGALITPSEGRSARLRLTVRGDAGPMFRLVWKSGRMERERRAGSGPATVEFQLDERHAGVTEFRLDCFNRGNRRGTGELLECVKIEA